MIKSNDMQKSGLNKELFSVLVDTCPHPSSLHPCLEDVADLPAFLPPRSLPAFYKVILEVSLNPDLGSITRHTLKNKKGRFRLRLFYKESYYFLFQTYKDRIPMNPLFYPGGWSTLAPPSRNFRLQTYLCLPFIDVSPYPHHQRPLKCWTQLCLQHFPVSWLLTGTPCPTLWEPCVFFFPCPNSVSPPAPLSLRTLHAQSSCDPRPWIRIYNVHSLRVTRHLSVFY